MADTKKKSFIRLTEHHMPHMKGMELGKKYHISATIEPTELSTGESEYSGLMKGMDGKEQKEPMRGTFKVHEIHHLDKTTKSSGKATGRYKEKK